MDALVIIIIVWFFIGRAIVKKRAGSGIGSSITKAAAKRNTRMATAPESGYEMPEGAMINTALFGQPVEQQILTEPQEYKKAMSGKGGSDLKKKYKENAAMHEAKFRRLEDRENDWLARQIREEAKWKRNSCFDPAAELKRSHADSCDARNLKNEHAKNHRKGRI